MKERLEAAVVGLGVGVQHVAAFRALGDLFEVGAVCDIDETRRTKVAEKLEVPRACSSYEELLEMDSIDVIDICTPPHLHFEQIEQGLRAGKHVICEKPLVGSLAEVDALARIEAESGRRIMPIFQYRFGNGLQKLKHLVDRGVAGTCYLSTIETSWRRGTAYYAVEWRGRWETELGGVLLTHAIHAHDMLCYIVGPIQGIFGRTTTRVNDIETEDCAAISLEMRDGSLATLSATLGSAVEISRLRFCFEHLTAESDLAPYTPSFEPWTITPATPDDEGPIQGALQDFEPGHQLYAGQFCRFHEALGSGTELPVTLSDARASLELITAMYYSSQTGDPVKLPIDEGHPRYGSWLPKEGR